MLLVDDNAQVVQSLALVLSLEGYEITKAADLKAVRDVAKEHAIAVAFCDYTLEAGQTGLDVPAILEEERAANQPAAECLLLTGHAQKDVEKEAAKAGFREVLLKPPALSVIREAAKQGMERYAAASKES